jgi:ubiquinone/menaquinone biosynthesis C-methylase UbiE
MLKACQIIEIIESEKKFWASIYKSEKAHWLDKKPSNLSKKVVRKFGNLGNVLEIGCAAGIDTFYLAEHSTSIVGIDIVPDAIEIAKENLTKLKPSIQKKITFETGDAERLKYRDDSFDFVYSLSVLHSTNISKSLPEVKRVLTDKGRAVIYVYTGDGKEEVDQDKFLDVCQDLFEVTKQEEIEIKKDAGEDTHHALIVWLEVKNA